MAKFFILTAILIKIIGAEEKWVWGNNDESGDLKSSAAGRYEVYEDYENRPGQFPQQRPPNRPNYRPIRPGGGFGTRPDYDGILTGPVPSGIREPPFKNYDRCKCTEKFNCQGLAYGQCDVGKQYCCYNSRGDSFDGSDYPSRPIHSIENGILSGPGGPVDYPRPGGFTRPFGGTNYLGPQRPARPDYYYDRRSTRD